MAWAWEGASSRLPGPWSRGCWPAGFKESASRGSQEWATALRPLSRARLSKERAASDRLPPASTSPEPRTQGCLSEWRACSALPLHLCGPWANGASLPSRLSQFKTSGVKDKIAAVQSLDRVSGCAPQAFHTSGPPRSREPRRWRDAPGFMAWL